MHHFTHSLFEILFRKFWISKKALFFCFFVIGTLFHLSVFGQDKFNERLGFIDKELMRLSESDIPQLKEKVEFSLVNASLQELLRGVAQIHKLNVSVQPDLGMSITNNFTQVTVRDLLLFLCKEYRLDVEFVNNILSVKQFKIPLVEVVKERKRPKIEYNADKDLLSVDLKRDSLSLFVRELVRITGKNVILDPDVQERELNGLVKDLPFEKGLRMIGYANALFLENNDDKQEGIFVIRNRDKNSIDLGGVGATKNKQNSLQAKKGELAADESEDLRIDLSEDSLLSVVSNNVAIIDIIKKAAKLSNKEYVFLNKPEGSKFVRFNRVTFDVLLDYLFKGTTDAFMEQEGVYVIGKRMEEGFRTTRLVKFQFRTIWEIEKVIPKALSENVQITAFEELNAIILTGSYASVKEIEFFLKEIDQPVPNIMIDVMVINVTESKTKKTGITAVVGDSVSTTQGSVFPGIDMTVGSNSVNRLLDKFQQFSTVNLGRLQPNFYITLKALETNGDVKVKSTPRLSTLNGHVATLTIGKSVYYEEKTQNVTGGVNPIITTTPRYSKVDANLMIKIKPIVSGDENVTLDIETEFSDFIPSQIDGAPPGNATRKFISQIKVLNEEVVLLGGLEEVSKDEQHSGVPILSRIPILKWLFSSSSKSSSESKLLVLIKPRIL